MKITHHFSRPTNEGQMITSTDAQKGIDKIQYQFCSKTLDEDIEKIFLYCIKSNQQKCY
jgi:hypothetical protein